MGVLQTSPLGLLGTAPRAKKYNETGVQMSGQVARAGDAGKEQNLTQQADTSCLSARGCATGRRSLAGSDGWDLCVADEAGGFLGRSGANIESCAPLEARHPGELWDDFNMPVVVLVDFFADGRRVDHEVVGWPVQHHIEAH